jgi:hypothetical protein
MKKRSPPTVQLIPAVLALPLLEMASSVGFAQPLSSVAVELSSDGGGPQIWQYTYSVAGLNFQVNEGFSIFFDPHLYANLRSIEPAVSSDWSVLAVQPDITLSQDGYFDGR